MIPKKNSPGGGTVALLIGVFLVLVVGAVALVRGGGGSVDAAEEAPEGVSSVEASGGEAGAEAPAAEASASVQEEAGVGEAGAGESVLAPVPVGSDEGTAIAAKPLPPLGEDVFPDVAAPRVPKPRAVKGLYLNAWTAGSSRRMSQLIALADSTEINSFVIDVKDVTGYVSYATGVALARQIGADKEIRIRDIRGLLERLRQHGIYPIARIVVFKDQLLAKRRPDLAIQKEDGSVWIDHNGELWIDAFNREVWDYAIALAREAVLLGFSEVQWDYVRFPDVPDRFMKTAVYPARAGRTKEDAIREFLKYSREQLADLGVPVTADVFGLTVSAPTDMGIGQRWEKMVDVTDVLLPMVYPSHYAKGSYGIPVPNADPYTTVKKAMDYAVERTRGVEGAASIRPWLQDFTLGWPSYGAAEVRAQIQATYDAGLEEWVLWNPSSRYTAAALAPKGGEPPKLPIPVHRPQVTIGDSVLEPRLSPAGGAKLLGVPVPEPVRPIAPKDTTGGR